MSPFIELLGVLFGGGGIFALWYKNRLDRKAREEEAERLRQERGLLAIREHVDIYTFLQEFRQEIGAARVVIVKVHNGGSEPSAKTFLYSSALFEVTAADISPLWERWKNLRIDEEYSMHLKKVIDDGVSIIDVPELPRDCTLAVIYSTAQVQSVIKYYLTHDQLGTYYLSLQFKEQNFTPEANAAFAIKSAVPKLKRMLRGEDG